MTKIDRDAFQKRLDRMTELFSDMVGHADELSQTRCPYRDRHDRCTAQIRCRNQRPPRAKDELLQCGHDGTLDYRSAWESDPNAYQRAKTKVEKIKCGAAKRRNTAKPRKPAD